MPEILTGDEKFEFNGKETDLNILEMWRWKYSDIYDIKSILAEYIVEKALGLEKSQNVGTWTLYDIKYRDTRIEVKETSYFHSWDKVGEKRSKQRTFGITKAYSKYKDSSSPFERQNDIYVFCLNTGYEREESYPLNLNNWEFYVIPTKVINQMCKDNKTIGLNVVRKLSDVYRYDQIKEKIDEIIDNME